MRKRKMEKAKKSSGKKILAGVGITLAAVAVLGAAVVAAANFWPMQEPEEPTQEPETPVVETITSHFYENVLSYNFEDRETGAFTISTGLHLNGATGEVVEPSALNGNKSLQLTTNLAGEAANWNALMESAFSPVVGQRYLVSMKLKYTMPEELSTGVIAVRLVENGGAENNGLFISVGKTETHHLNGRSDDETSYVYDSATGIFSLNVYMTADSSAQEVHLTTIGGGAWSLVVDDFSITKVTTTVTTVEK